MTPESPTPQSPNSAYISNPFALISPSFDAFIVNAKSYILGGLAWVGIVLGVSLVLVLVTVIVFSVLGQVPGIFTAVGLGIVGLAALLYYSFAYVYPATYRMMLAMARREKMTVRQALTFEKGLGSKLLGSSLLAGLAVLGGFLLLIVPGIIFAVWFSQVPFVVVEEKLSGRAALRRSRELVRNRFWEILGTRSVPQVVSILQVIPLAGAFASFVILLFLLPMGAIRYVQLRELKAGGEEAARATKISGWNYIAIAAAVVVFIVNAVVSAATAPKHDPSASPTPGVYQSL